MSLIRMLYLWCDVPGCDEEYGPYPNEGAMKIRAAAKRQGWEYKTARSGADIFADFCPQHTGVAP